jgi:RHS repeat-associated protein
VINASQTVVGTIAYEGFGQSVGTTGSSSSPYLFAATSGYRNDGDAGLVHVGARYYDAQAGLFLTRDTYLEQKPYLYCEHDPVNRVDPTGHEAEDWWARRRTDGGIIGGIGTIVTLLPSLACPPATVAFTFIALPALMETVYNHWGIPIANRYFGPDTFPNYPKPTPGHLQSPNEYPEEPRISFGCRRCKQ